MFPSSLVWSMDFNALRLVLNTFSNFRKKVNFWKTNWFYIIKFGRMLLEKVKKRASRNHNFLCKNIWWRKEHTCVQKQPKLFITKNFLLTSSKFYKSIYITMRGVKKKTSRERANTSPKDLLLYFRFLRFSSHLPYTHHCL